MLVSRRYLPLVGIDPLAVRINGRSHASQVLGGDPGQREQGAAVGRALEGPATATTSPATAMSPADREAALALLRDPQLLDRITHDFAQAGVVGERTNLLVGYLAAVSRKLPAPLAVIIQSASAAGKTSLMDAVLAFVPPEERVHYAAMTGQALYYLGETDLRHKVLSVVEEEAAERASYTLKLLQSEGELTIASTGKDPQTGKLVTHEYRVEGPVQLMLATTALTLDEGLANRALVLTVDESAAQTRAIHQRQREARTLDGLLARTAREALCQLHQNAQRLLEPVAVVNPYAPALAFGDARTRARRDHEKYLTLIEAIALLHQHQRERRQVERHGRTLTYLEVTPEDLALANRLAAEVLGRALDELPPQTRRFLTGLDQWVIAQCAEQHVSRESLRFSARQAREATGLGATQVKLHLHRLVELEYVVVHRPLRGVGVAYELLATEPVRPWLTEPVDVSGYDPGRSGVPGGRSAPVGGWSDPAKRHQATARRGVSLGSVGPVGNAHLDRVARSRTRTVKPLTEPTSEPSRASPRRCRAHERNPTAAADRHSLTALIAEHAAWLTGAGYAATTVRSRVSSLTAFTQWAAERGVTRPAQLTLSVLERYQQTLAAARQGDGRPLSWGARAHEIGALRRFGQWLARTHHVASNPAQELVLPRRPQSAAARGAQCRGSRADPGAPRRHHADGAPGSGHARDPLLHRHPAARADSSHAPRRRSRPRRPLRPRGPQLVVPPDLVPLFLTRRGRPVRENRLTELVHRYVQAAGLGKQGSCHLFRHTMATLLLEGGADVREVQEMLGRSHLSTTALYTHVAIGRLKQVHQAAHPAERGLAPTCQHPHIPS